FGCVYKWVLSVAWIFFIISAPILGVLSEKPSFLPLSLSPCTQKHPTPPGGYCSPPGFLGHHCRIRPPLGVAPAPKEPGHLPLSIPTNLSRWKHL
ncbi:unnamed protein product, partial [Prunus brigantina]